MAPAEDALIGCATTCGISARRLLLRRASTHSLSAPIPGLMEVSRRGSRLDASERVFTLGGRHGRIGPFGSWGCQVSTGLRDRRSQVEVARRPRKTAGKASNWQQQLRPRCLVSEHRRRPPSPDGEDVIRGGAAPPTPVSDVKEPRGTPDSVRSTPPVGGPRREAQIGRKYL